MKPIRVYWIPFVIAGITFLGGAITWWISFYSILHHSGLRFGTSIELIHPVQLEKWVFSVVTAGLLGLLLAIVYWSIVCPRKPERYPPTLKDFLILLSIVGSFLLMVHFAFTVCS